MIKKAIFFSVLFAGFETAVQAQTQFEAPLCAAAKNQQVIELVYDKDKSKGCEPRIVDVHQVAIGKNGQLYMRGWQRRGCTKGRDFEAMRTYRFDKIKSVVSIDGTFGEKSEAKKQEGWDGCLGSNCFIEKNICE
ncbi:MAG: WYL domain-containing protein [Rhizobiaceae bacterium]|nr:WYL domain-containing protein [Rhizobiaceae bacterium]